MFNTVDDIIRRDNPLLFKQAEANKNVTHKFQAILHHIYRFSRGRVKRVVIDGPFPCSNGFDAEFKIGVK